MVCSFLVTRFLLAFDDKAIYILFEKVAFVEKSSLNFSLLFDPFCNCSFDDWSYNGVNLFNVGWGLSQSKLLVTLLLLLLFRLFDDKNLFGGGSNEYRLLQLKLTVSFFSWSFDDNNLFDSSNNNGSGVNTNDGANDNNCEIYNDGRRLSLFKLAFLIDVFGISWWCFNQYRWWWYQQCRIILIKVGGIIFVILLIV